MTLTTMSTRENQLNWMFKKESWEKDLEMHKLTMNKKDKEICKINRPS